MGKNQEHHLKLGQKHNRRGTILGDLIRIRIDFGVYLRLTTEMYVFVRETRSGTKAQLASWTKQKLV